MEQGTQKLWGEAWWVSQELGGVLGGVSPPHQGPVLSPPIVSLCEPSFPSYCLSFPSVESGSAPCPVARGTREAHRQWMHKAGVTTDSRGALSPWPPGGCSHGPGG